MENNEQIDAAQPRIIIPPTDIKADGIVPEVPPAPSSAKVKSGPDTGRVFCSFMAGRILYGVSGNAIIFDADGYATPNAEDRDHLLSVPGYKKA